MAWLIWVLIGAALGWWADVLFGRKAHPQPDPDRERRIRARRHGLWLTLLAVAVGCAAGQFFDVFGPGYYATQSFLLSPRVVALAGGGALGFWASRYRQLIAARSHEFYRALLGSETKSSWALQSAVAIFALFTLALVVEPDLLEHLESFKAGDVEAKFSSVSATTREAGRIVLNALHQDVTIEQWIDFKKNFRSDDKGNRSPRDTVVELFDNSKIKSARKEIRDLLFDRYIEPLAIVLGCLNKYGRLDELKRSEGLAALAADFRAHIIEESRAGSGSYFTEDEWTKLLKATDEQMVHAVSIIDEFRETTRCAKYGPDPTAKKRPDESELKISSIRGLVSAMKKARSAQPGSGPSSENGEGDEVRRLGDLARKFNAARNGDAANLKKSVIQAVDILKNTPAERNYTLSYIDPYVIGAVGDLLSLTFGVGEKASFLTLIKSKYPAEMYYLQPGLINLNYQAADAKTRGETTWPLDEKIEDLAQAMRGVDFIIAETKRLAGEAKNKAPAVGGPKPDAATNGAPDASGYDKILGVYFINKFVFTKAFLEIYYQQFLAGDPITEQTRIRWLAVYRQMEKILKINGMGMTLATSDPGGDEIATVDVPKWKSALDDVEGHLPSHLLDARVAMALSSIMLESSERHPRAQACSVGRFYLSDAKAMLRTMELPPLELDKGDISRLGGFLLQVGARIDASCGRF